MCHFFHIFIKQLSISTRYCLFIYAFIDSFMYCLVYLIDSTRSCLGYFSSRSTTFSGRFFFGVDRCFNPKFCSKTAAVLRGGLVRAKESSTLRSSSCCVVPPPFNRPFNHGESFNGGDPNHLLNGMIPYKILEKPPCIPGLGFFRVDRITPIYIYIYIIVYIYIYSPMVVAKFGRGITQPNPYWTTTITKGY